MIDPNKKYTLYEIAKDELIPGVTTTVKASNLVRTDKATRNLLDAEVIFTDDGKVLQYRIPGQKLIEYNQKNA